ncbi:hypothetical protein ACIA8K_33295 [Catenuloplanes sp. NPDC051500]
MSDVAFLLRVTEGMLQVSGFDCEAFSQVIVEVKIVVALTAL